MLKLTDDILGKIFMQLQSNDMENFAKTCKRFHKVYQDNVDFRLNDVNLLNEMNHSELSAAYVERLLTNDNIIDQTKATNLINRYFSAVKKICIKSKPVLRLSLLKDLKCITKLKLVVSGLSDRAISLMEQFDKLEILDVSDNKELTGKHFSNLQPLKELKLRGCANVTGYYLVEIFQRHSNLRVLDVKDCDILSNHALNEMIMYCDNLEDITITYVPKRYNCLKALPKLKKLRVFIRLKLECIESFIRNLVSTKTLESLEVSSDCLSKELQKPIISAIANLTQLKRLILDYNLNVAGYHILCRLTNLEYFSVFDAFDAELLLNLLTKCTKLKCVIVKRHTKTIVIFKMIDLLKSLPARQNPVVLSVYNSGIDRSILKDPKYLAAKSVFSVILPEKEETCTEVFALKVEIQPPIFKPNYDCKAELDPPIFKLNYDCIRRILSQLPRDDQISFGCVFPRFDDIFVDHYHLSLYKPDSLRWLQINGRTAKSLLCGSISTLSDCPPECLTGVKHIRILLNRRLFRDLHFLMENVKELILQGCDLEDEDILEIRNLPILEYLWFEDNKLTGKYMCELEKLKQLILRGCNSIESAHFIHVYKSLRELEFLNIEECEMLDDSAFQEINRHCNKLVHFELTLCPDVEYSWLAQLPKLKHLRIANYEVSQSLVEHILWQLTESNQLESIWVHKLDLTDNCINIIAKLTQLKRFETEVLTNNHSNNWLQAFGPLKQLEKIILGFKSELTNSDDELLELFHECNKLKYITIKTSWSLTNTFFLDVIDILMKRQPVWNEPFIMAVVGDMKCFEEILTNPRIINAERNNVMIVVQDQMENDRYPKFNCYEQ